MHKESGKFFLIDYERLKLLEKSLIFLLNFWQETSVIKEIKPLSPMESHSLDVSAVKSTQVQE